MKSGVNDTERLKNDENYGDKGENVQLETNLAREGVSNFQKRFKSIENSPKPYIYENFWKAPEIKINSQIQKNKKTLDEPHSWYIPFQNLRAKSGSVTNAKSVNFITPGHFDIN